MVNYEIRLLSSSGSVVADLVSDAISINIDTGKFRQLDSYDPGSASIVFNNYSRKFDPTNTSSPIYGYVVPKLPLEIWCQGNIIFSGLIDDWAFSYDVNGESTATVTLSDWTTLFANQYLDATYFPAELSGARVNRVLDANTVAWSTAYGDRLLDSGTQLLDADIVESGTNVLDYLRKIEASEQGQIFAWGNKAVKFEDNSRTFKSNDVIEIFADDGSINNTSGTAKASIPYQTIDVSYTSQLLYNRIVVTAWDGVNNAVGNVSDSQSDYSINQLDIDGVIYSDYQKLYNLASYLGAKYGYPEYRFNSLTVNAYGLGDSFDYYFLSNTRLNKFAKVIFTPNGTGSAISRYVRIIGVQHSIDSGSHLITFQFDSIRVPSLVLDDASFGILDTNVMGL